MNKKIMILGASILQLPAIQTAKKMGLQVIAVDMNPDAIGFHEEGVIKEIVSTTDIPAVLNLAKKHRIDGVMTLASDMPMRTVATVAKELGLVGVTEATAMKATNKAYMRCALQEYGVPIPVFYRVASKKDYYKAVSKLRVPFMVKPADNSGSRGVVKVADATDQSIIEEAYEYSRASSRSGEVVVEEYMSGPEVSVETLTVDGECHVIQITDKITTGAPHFVEMGHTQPSRLPTHIKQRIKEVAQKANAAIGITNGPSHTEIIVTEDGPKIVELGARLGGDCITTHLVPLSTGVDMVEACIKIALGERPCVEAQFFKGSAIRYFSCETGKIKEIAGIEEAKAIDGVTQISVVHGVGAAALPISSSVDRIGFVVAQGKDADEAALICDRALQKVKISVESAEK